MSRAAAWKQPVFALRTSFCEPFDKASLVWSVVRRAVVPPPPTLITQPDNFTRICRGRPFDVFRDVQCPVFLPLGGLFKFQLNRSQRCILTAEPIKRVLDMFFCRFQIGSAAAPSAKQAKKSWRRNDPRR